MKNLKIIKGFDNNSRPFTAFAICNDQDNKRIAEATENNKSININDLNIIYSMDGHYLNEEVRADIQEYYKEYCKHIGEESFLTSTPEYGH